MSHVSAGAARASTRSQCVTGLVAHLYPWLAPSAALQSFKIVLDELCGIMPRFFRGSPSLSVGKLFLSTNNFLQYVPKDRGDTGGMDGTGMLPWVHLCSSLDMPAYIAAANAVRGHEGSPAAGEHAGGGREGRAKGCVVINIRRGQAIGCLAESWKNGSDVNAPAIKCCLEYLGRKFQPSASTK